MGFGLNLDIITLLPEKKLKKIYAAETSESKTVENVTHANVFFMRLRKIKLYN